jgi:hypothetical protein
MYENGKEGHVSNEEMKELIKKYIPELEAKWQYFWLTMTE